MKIGEKNNKNLPSFIQKKMEETNYAKNKNKLIGSKNMLNQKQKIIMYN